MILINKELAEQRILVTVSESTTVESPVYTLQLHSTFIKRTFDISLSANTSQHKERYDEFKIPTVSFNELDAGFYTYTILESTDGIVEVGVAKVLDKVLDKQEQIEEEFVPFKAEEVQDDYVVYTTE